ncbi:MAG: hypothetical protein ABI183_16720 [Polyangiaceae bacterium]
MKSAFLTFLTPARRSAFAIAIVCPLSFPLFGCSKIAGWAIDKAIGDDAGLAEEALAGGSSSGPASTTKVCDLVTDAEIEAATGRKLVNKGASDDSTCAWGVSANGKEDLATAATINLQILNELEMKIIPVAGAQKDIPGLGNKAEWSGGMAPNLRVHVKNGKVLNFMFIDPGLMMKNTGITEKKIDNNNSVVNMEYPELEKEAIAIGKAAAGRY